MMKPYMIYGASGYTGRLIARAAAARGRKPVLAGRDAVKIEPLAAELGCDCRVFPLTGALAQPLDGMAAVLHCAGPFRETAAPMMEACLAAGVHYLDITGEIDVIEAAAQRHQRAQAAGIALLPAVGMDVVPSDCLAARLAARLPGAIQLELAFAGMASVSHGTAATIWENAGRGGRVRRDGQIVRVGVAWNVQRIPFRRGPQLAMTIPWGDVASAYHTTGIPNIAVYAALPPAALRVFRALRWLAPLAGLPPVQAAGRWWIDRRVRGPGDEELRRGRVEFWGRVTDAAGRTAEATLETPNGYALTVETSLAVLQAVLEGRIRAGFSTPASALGADLMDAIPDLSFR
jgi:short subunit dehydrogenase-like uncharacterized protein